MAPEVVGIARRLRMRAGQIEPKFSTRAIVSACFPGAVVTGRRLPTGIHEAVAQTADGPLIIYNRSLSLAEQRFAIAHALAHLLFDGRESQCRPGFAGDPCAEARADEFAEELLLPLESLHGLVARRPSDDAAEHEIYLDSVDEIASRFHVPSVLVDRRIRELISRGMIS